MMIHEQLLCSFDPNYGAPEERNNSDDRMKNKLIIKRNVTVRHSIIVLSNNIQISLLYYNL